MTAVNSASLPVNRSTIGLAQSRADRSRSLSRKQQGANLQFIVACQVSLLYWATILNKHLLGKGAHPISVPRFRRSTAREASAQYQSEQKKGGTHQRTHGPLAQLAEQQILNKQVTGSIPVRLTKKTKLKKPSQHFKLRGLLSFS